MPEADRTIKTGDTYKPLVRVVVDDAGRAINLSGASQVRFIARGPTRIHAVMSVITVQAAVDAGWLKLPAGFNAADLPVPAAVMWDIQPGETDVPPGDYPFEVEVTWAPGDVETFPPAAADNPVLRVDADRDRVAA